MKPRQAKALAFIEEFIRGTGGISPSLGQITKAMGYKSRTTAFRIVAELKEMGALKTPKGSQYRPQYYINDKCPFCGKKR